MENGWCIHTLSQVRTVPMENLHLFDGNIKLLCCTGLDWNSKKDPVRFASRIHKLSTTDVLTIFNRPAT